MPTALVPVVAGPDGKIYAELQALNTDPPTLVEIDPNTGDCRTLFTLQQRLGSLTYSPGYSLYGRSGSQIWRVDPSTGQEMLLTTLANANVPVDLVVYIPEPGSLLLMAMGVGLLRRRQRSAWRTGKV